MIVSDKYQFIIANPPKTGTTSLHGLVDRWKKSGGPPEILTHLRGGEDRNMITRHRLAPPKGREHYTRVLMSRDPVSRLTSMYEFFRLRKNDQRWIAPGIQGVEEKMGREQAWLWMLGYLLSIRQEPGYMNAGIRGEHGIQPYMWTDNQWELWRYMGGKDINGKRLPWFRSHRGRPFVLRLESFAWDWNVLVGTLGIEEPGLWEAQLPRRNAVPDSERLFASRDEYLGVEGAAALVEDLCGGSEGLERNMRLFGAGRLQHRVL